ncbi:MAG TPA: M20/M25/M40 family metallo-hydrolase [Pyrinomonadaceae bacterium]|nr:M20/M25/M40 family metallo-hydrolase [Pyrinomonadaceae bacterium]
MSAQEPEGPRISTPEVLKSEFASVPCWGKERLEAAKSLFAKLGADDKDMTVEKFKRAENLVVRKPSHLASAETIVIGAHYDKVIDGCGAVDNWTGIVAVAHIYHTLRDVPLKKNVLFVAFGNEEEGLFGSHGMANAIDKTQVEQYCAMINIDSLGLAAPQVLDNTSSRKMIQLAENTAKEMKMPFAHASVDAADADSSSFVSRKIPAVTIHGLTKDWSTILHSQKDQASRVNVNSVYLGYRLALAMLLKVDQSACTDYR